MQKESIDLMNVDYDDVLHLYRGWRKSENLLKDKDKELNSLKSRIKQLQDSHQQFRSQIQALESVKELTITLQTELTTLQQENKQYYKENQELVTLNLQAEELLKEKDSQENEQSKLLQKVQIEFATLKGRYEETLKIQKELESLATNEQAVRMSLENRLQQADQTVEMMNEENRQLKQKLELANHKLHQCDQELLHASEQLSSISKEFININNTKEALATAQAENGVLRGDITRLLRLLEYSPATKDFIDQWQTSEGMHFAGFDPSSVTRGSTGNSFELTGGGGFLDSTYNTLGEGPESAGNLESKYDLSAAEFAQLKRIHGRDPFPMTNTYAEENEYWVPKDAAKLGLNFLSSKFPHTSPQVIMEFLRSMNKIWLRRERRKVKKVKEVLGSTIDDLKRQLSHLKPYRGVLAETQIKRLKSQVKESRSKTLHGRAKKKLEEDKYNRDMFEATDINNFNSMNQSRRFCKQVENSKHYHDSAITQVSTEKFLEASLLSLETLSRRKSGLNNNNHQHYNEDEERDGDNGNYSRSIFDQLRDQSEEAYPNSSYLRGAIWLGRNLTILSEELGEAIESYRIRYLQEIADITKDNDYKRSCHRLTVIATTGINHTCSLANRSKDTIREVLEGVSALEPGNAAQFQRFLATLPIESAFTASGVTQKKRSNSFAKNSRIGTEGGNYNNATEGGGGGEGMESPISRKSPNRSIRFTSILDSPLFTADLNKTPK